MPLDLTDAELAAAVRFSMAVRPPPGRKGQPVRRYCPARTMASARLDAYAVERMLKSRINRARKPK
jgi:hypothetical protein